jgi:TetR/AcrR family transcriptional repressor of nem operon
MPSSASPEKLTSGRARAPGRPREFDQETVLDAALTYFWQKGSRATTRQLEEALGLSQSSIYNAFGSKQGLLDQALDRYEAQASVALIDPLRKSEDGLDGIQDFFVNLSDWIVREDRRGCMLINMMAEDGSNTPAIVARAKRYRDRVRSALIEALKRSAARGESAEADIEGHADLLMCLVLGFNVAARGGASTAELSRLMDSVFVQCQGWRLKRAA